MNKRRLDDGTVVEEVMHHHLFLTGMHADSICRQKLARWPGMNAYLACGWCVLRSTRCPTYNYPKVGIRRHARCPNGRAPVHLLPLHRGCQIRIS